MYVSGYGNNTVRTMSVTKKKLNNDKLTRGTKGDRVVTIVDGEEIFSKYSTYRKRLCP